jgi:glycosyltransferase involved in cell wall biosynthesis
MERHDEQSCDIGEVNDIALLTGGGDKPYALGLAGALTSLGISLDFVGSDDLSVPELLTNEKINFLNLRGDQRPEATAWAKVTRIVKYYCRLIYYAATARPRLFHILWDNKLEFFDRTLLMVYYKLLRKKLVRTVHNVNAGRRDANDTWLNRLSLKMLYRLSDHMFVHTEKMKREMIADFGVPADRVSVIPFGINNTVPNTSFSRAEARRHLGLQRRDKAMLFFGNIAPYKGLNYLVAATTQLLERDSTYCLIIVGRPKGDTSHWNRIKQAIEDVKLGGRIIQRIEYIPDEETEIYFKAADVLVLPYTHVFQSGVLFLGYSFGLPAIAADVGSLREEIIEGETGLMFRPRDPVSLASTIEKYFASSLFQRLEQRRQQIREYANRRYSWTTVVNITGDVYSKLLQVNVPSDIQQAHSCPTVTNEIANRGCLR